MLYTESSAALDLAVSPVILISAVGLLLLTLNNRLSQSIIRARSLRERANSAPPAVRHNLEQQIDIIWKRTRHIRRSIVFAILSAVAAALLVILLFLKEMYGFSIPYALSSLFIASLCALLVAFTCLILDVQQSLRALELELRPKDDDHPSTSTSLK